jgi:O-antigen/teichoic acid export membrane protein
MCFALYAEDIVSLIFAELWGPVAPILIIMCGARALFFLSILLEPTLVCRDRSNDQLKTRVIGAAVLFISLLVFGRQSGEAAAYAYGFSTLVLAVISMYLMMQELKISLVQILRAFIPALAITLLCVVVTQSSAGLRSTMDPVEAFAGSVIVLATLWALSIGLCIRFRILKLPLS